jgi:hypothetical protein
VGAILWANSLDEPKAFEELAGPPDLRLTRFPSEPTRNPARLLAACGSLIVINEIVDLRGDRKGYVVHVPRFLEELGRLFDPPPERRLAPRGPEDELAPLPAQVVLVALDLKPRLIKRCRYGSFPFSARFANNFSK